MLKIDLHIHSIASGHAYGTIYEIAKEAAKKGMDIIAITDHGPAVIGGYQRHHFGMVRRAPKFIEGVRLLWGCEANIIDVEGKIDLEEKYRKLVDVLIVGLHDECFEDQGIEQNTEALIRAFEDKYVKIVSHPVNNNMPVDIKRVCNAAIDNGILVELNLSYLLKYGQDHLDKFKELVDTVKARNAKLIVNSDAHFLHEIGDDSILLEYKEELGLTDDIIINNFPQELLEFLGIKDE